jgi:hypothetical protein
MSEPLPSSFDGHEYVPANGNAHLRSDAEV